MTRIFVMAAVAAMMTLAQPVKASGMLEISKKYIGMSERKNRKQLKAMMGFDPRSPWCGAFLTAVAKKSGKKPPKGHNMARSWLRWGNPVKASQARPGDVVVVRSVRNHVGIYKRSVAGKVCLISGNSRDMVREACYARSRVLGVRRG